MTVAGDSIDLANRQAMKENGLAQRLSEAGVDPALVAEANFLEHQLERIKTAAWSSAAVIGELAAATSLEELYQP